MLIDEQQKTIEIPVVSHVPCVHVQDVFLFSSPE